MAIKSLLITFDYELFLGKRSGSVDNCLIKPTGQILKVLNKYNQKALFFIDTTYLLRLSEVKSQYQNASTDYDRICEQLIQLAKDGHQLFHHLHPHWLDAEYIPEINQWNLSNNKRFVFSSIEKNEKNKIFNFSNEFLNQIYLEAKVNKQPNGFRAGGLFIEPFSEFFPYFKKFNILNEFSVVSNTFRNDNRFSYDFRGSPINRPYSFQNKIGIEDKEGDFVEYPISLMEINGFSKLRNSMIYRINTKNPEFRPFGDGNSFGHKAASTDIKKKIKDIFSMRLPASIEFLNPGNISCYLSFLNKNNYFHLLSHPKLLTPISIKMFDCFLEKTLKTTQIVNPDFSSNLPSDNHSE
ncbi:MAG: hypothetical protein FJZ67_03630 [Bacteroidetes bacterium]|nr:hypothetical protein [Bacteroidota bacterium]